MEETADVARMMLMEECTSVNIVTRPTSAIPHSILTQNKSTPQAQMVNNEPHPLRAEAVVDHAKI